MVVLLCLLRKVCICFNFLLGCLVLYCSWVFSLNICVTCSCRWFFGKRKKKERWNKTDNKSGNGSRTAWVNEFLVAGAWQEPVPFNTAGHYPSAHACVDPFRLPSTRLILSKSYAFVSLARPSWALGLPVLAASPDQPLACMAILLLVSQFKQTLTLQSLLCFSQSELPFSPFSKFDGYICC